MPKKIIAAFLLLFTGCTVHPPGELPERQAALQAGKPFKLPPDARNVPALPPNPSPDDLVRYALLTNPDVEQKYWAWRSAIEQIPQDGTQATNLILSANLGFSRGQTGLDQTSLSAGNDPMADIVLPSKLSTAARRAMENARAAGLRFHKAQFDLRNKVLSAYYDYALASQLIHLEEANAQLLKTTAMAVEARNRAGTSGQQDLLKARNEVDLSNNSIATMQAQLPAQRAAINALLSREPDAPIAIATDLPASPAMTYSDEQLLSLAANKNPELAALVHEIGARKEGITLARLQYLPDFSISAGTDLQGIAQSLLGTVTVPALRHEAIDAAIAQAMANLRATEAMRRQARNDLNVQVILDITTLRDADRQLDLFQHTVLPRAQQIVTLARSAYEAGRATLLDLLDSQRSLISIERLIANLRTIREKRLADLEAIAGHKLDGSGQ